MKRNTYKELYQGIKEIKQWKLGKLILKVSRLYKNKSSDNVNKKTKKIR